METEVSEPIFPYLIDDPDGGFEEEAWLPASAAATPEEACAEFERRWEVDGMDVWWETDGLRLVSRGRVYLRAYLDVDDGEEVGRVFGTEAEALALRDGVEFERLRFETCEPDDDGAAEWWRIEVVE